MGKKLNNKRIMIMVVLLGVLYCCFILTGCSNEDICWNLNDESVVENSNENDQDINDFYQDVLPQTKIIVYVCGEVNNPGVYELNADCRLYEAIDAAGGMTDKANKNFQNLARVIEDGEQILIPDMQASEDENLGSAVKKNNLININNANVKELTEISGIGESRATAIIMYREQHGKFKKIDDIKKVDGIKDALFQKIKDQITV